MQFELETGEVGVFQTLLDMINMISFVGRFNFIRKDKVDVLMDFDQGFSGYIHLNFLEKKVHRVLRINGLDGSISCDLVHGKININTVSGNREIDLSEEKNDMYLEELTSFLECIETQKTPVVTLDDGVRVIEIVEAVKQSSANRQRIGV